MAVTFKNIRSGEVRVAETDAMISALWASSDRGPNANQGQDFGWRLAAEVVVEMRRIRKRPQVLREIAADRNMAVNDIGEKEILKYISDKTSFHAAPVAADEDYEDVYRDEIRRLEQEAAKAEAEDKPANYDLPYKMTPEEAIAHKQKSKDKSEPKQATKTQK